MQVISPSEFDHHLPLISCVVSAPIVRLGREATGSDPFPTSLGEVLSPASAKNTSMISRPGLSDIEVTGTPLDWVSPYKTNYTRQISRLIPSLSDQVCEVPLWVVQGRFYFLPQETSVEEGLCGWEDMHPNP